MSMNELTAAQAKELLGGHFFRNTFMPEQTLYRWIPKSVDEMSCNPEWQGVLDKPLLRFWDYKSGSIPFYEAVHGRLLPDPRMQARAPRMDLSQENVRENMLRRHWSVYNSTATPFISFMTSPDNITEFVRARAQRRGTPFMDTECPHSQQLIAIDPTVRLGKGLPLIHHLREALRYGIRSPQRLSPNPGVEDDYLCLFEVTPEEVVGSWHWTALQTVGPDWYDNVVMPAFEEYRAKRLSGSLQPQHPATPPSRAGRPSAIPLQWQTEEDVIRADLDRRRMRKEPYQFYALEQEEF